MLILEGMVKLYQEAASRVAVTVLSIPLEYMDEYRQVERTYHHLKLTHQEMATDLNSSTEVISRLRKKNGWVIMYRNSFESRGLRIIRPYLLSMFYTRLRGSILS